MAERTSFLRSVGVVGAIGVAVAGMAPTLALNLNPQNLAEHVGAAVPLVFALATVAITLVAWCFARLSRIDPSSGSAYTQVTASLGPRAGIVAGWALLGAYACFGAVNVSGMAIFASSVLDSFGIWADPNPDVIAVAATAIVIVLSLAPVHRVTMALLVVELTSVACMLALSVFVLSRVDFSAIDIGTGDLFWPAGGVAPSAIALALAFAVLSFAGFEEAATLGEEATHPERQIPIALIVTAIGGGLLFVVVTAAEVYGIYDRVDGMQAFEASPGLIQTLGDRYIGAGAGDAMELFAVASALAAGLSVVVATTRMLLALTRDLAPELPFARVSDDGGAPRVGIVAIAGASLAAYLALRVFAGASAQDVFFWSGSTSALLIVVAYLLVAVGAGRVMLANRGLGLLELAIPVIAVAILVYTLGASVYPQGEGAYAVIPYVVLGWLALAVVAPLLRPGMLARVGSS